jgi:hypothetical protein
MARMPSTRGIAAAISFRHFIGAIANWQKADGLFGHWHRFVDLRPRETLLQVIDQLIADRFEAGIRFLVVHCLALLRFRSGFSASPKTVSSSCWGQKHDFPRCWSAAKSQNRGALIDSDRQLDGVIIGEAP